VSFPVLKKPPADVLGYKRKPTSIPRIMTTANNNGSQKFSFFMYLISPNGLQIKQRNAVLQLLYRDSRQTMGLTKWYRIEPFTINRKPYTFVAEFKN